MKRLMWGAVLFLITVGCGTPAVSACDWKSMFAEVPNGSMMVNDGENVVWISADEDTVTVVVYDNTERNSDWM